MSAIAEDHDTFRNELASVARDGRRRWVYARQPSGRYYRARTVISWLLLGFLLLAPFITVRGQPLMLLNVLERRFVLLGVLFRPQDFYLVVLIALTVLVTLVLSTVVVGRVWCGWLCPQTVFMEMLFRRLEYLIEGSAERQLRRDRGPWTRDKVVRKGLKHAIFFGLSFVIANVFLAWIIGADELRVIVTDPPRRHLVGLASILIFSSVFYMVFARFREQACVLACPYGRVMSALIDTRTITVTYDRKRGEPRGRIRHRAAGAITLQSPTANAQPARFEHGTITSPGPPTPAARHPEVSGPGQPGSGDPTPGGDPGVAGDCIDCHQCVTVCPTAIDIRNGIQLECVNCTACMDACDAVMRRVGRREGLIRLTSHDAIQQGTSRWLTGRVAAYGTVWIALVASVLVLFAIRRDLDVLILRQPGTLYATVTGGDVANFYDVQAFNRTARTTAFTIEVMEPGGATVTPLGLAGEVGPYGQLEGRLVVRVSPAALTGPNTPLRFTVRSEDGTGQTIESAFVGPGGRE